MADDIFWDRTQLGQQNMAAQHVALTMKQRIDMAVAQAEERLKLAREAREILNKNPDIERLINILNQNPF